MGTNRGMPILKALRNALIIILIFAAVGPLVGLPIFGLGIAVAALSPPMFVFFLLYGVLFAHLTGIIPAVIAGLLVASYAAWRGIVPAWYAALAGLIGTAGIHDITGLLRENGPELSRAIAVLLPATCIGASLACTRLTRRWQTSCASDTYTNAEPTQREQ